MARNPVDHPMGEWSGQEQGRWRMACTRDSPWALLAKGGKTRRREEVFKTRYSGEKEEINGRS